LLINDQVADVIFDGLRHCLFALADALAQGVYSVGTPVDDQFNQRHIVEAGNSFAIWFA